MILIPKTLNNFSNLISITEEEIDSYYSITCVRNADYDFDKQVKKIIDEYVETLGLPEKSNKKRCYKSQLKKLIDDKPRNSKKYDNFNLWRLARRNYFRNKRKDNIIKMKNIDTTPVKDYNEVSEKDILIQKLMKENHELKEKLKRYESLEKPQPKEVIIYSSAPAVEEEEEIYVDVLDVVEDLVKEVEKLQVQKPPVKKEQKPDYAKAMEELSTKNETNNNFKTQNITEEKYKSIENDDERLEAFWENIDKVIEECEKIFINKYKRDKNYINNISDLFYDFHTIEFENLSESIENIEEPKYDKLLDKAMDRPFSVLKDNLYHEAK
jgi:hypothetical protein